MVVLTSLKKATQQNDRPSSTLRYVLLGGLILGVFLFLFEQESPDSYSIDDIITSSTRSVSSSSSGKQCLSRLQTNGILTEDEEASFGDQLCDSNVLLELMRADRLQIQQLERKEYLHKTRSYRLSGNICNRHTDADVPGIITEAAFKCLPDDYQRKACMNGRASFPNACSNFRTSNETPVEMNRKYGPYKANTIFGPNCNAPGKTCPAVVFATEKGKSNIAASQLAPGMGEAKVLKQRADQVPVWTQAVFDYLDDMISEKKDISPSDYPTSHSAIERALDWAGIKNKPLLVLGSISPWIEVLALSMGAKAPVVTVDYNPPVSLVPQLEVTLMANLLKDLNTWPLIISYSAIEHDGQGRYLDPLDPNGDLAAMKEAWLKLDPGGTFLINVPVGRSDRFYWYSMRVYGPARLPLLTRSWQYAGLATGERVYTPDEAFSLNEVKDLSPVLLLKKPRQSDSAFLDENGPGGLVCSPEGICSGRKTQ